ncbi:unnamed protein product [Prunus brigantina]
MNWVKINFDGYVRNNKVATGFVIRDWNGHGLLAGAKNASQASIRVAECLALRDTLAHAIHNGWRKICLATVAEVEMDLQRDQLEAQFQEFQNTVTTVSQRQDVVQSDVAEILKTLTTLSDQQTQNFTFQKTVMDELRTLRARSPVFPQHSVSPTHHPVPTQQLPSAWAIPPTGPILGYSQPSLASMPPIPPVQGLLTQFSDLFGEFLGHIIHSFLPLPPHSTYAFVYTPNETLALVPLGSTQFSPLDPRSQANLVLVLTK